MQCLTTDEMEEYITDAHMSQKQHVASHIATCFHCLTLYQKQRKEQDRWSQELFEEVLPDSFTTNVMALIEREEIELTTSNDLMKVPIKQDTIPNASHLEQSDGIRSVPVTVIEPTSVAETVSTTRKGLFKRRSTGFWKIMIGVAALLIIMSSVLMYSVPTLAEKLRSLFGQDSGVDIGLLRAQEFGLVEHPNINVKDKGYTIKIDEAVADPTRVIIALQLFGPDGKHDRNRLEFYPTNNITIKDDQGEIVGKLYDMGVTKDFYYMVAFFAEPLQTDRITIEGRISQLGNKSRNIQYLQGEWNFDFSIDLKEAKKKTMVKPLNSSYTTPDGMTVRLKRLTRMVQGVRLELDTELSEEALIRSPGELWKQQDLKFHFGDMQGNEIHSVNTRKVPSKDSVMAGSHLPGDKPGLMHWSYTFKYLPQDNPYTFVFDGYSVSERDDASIQFEPSKLKDHPVPFYADGDEIMLKDFTIESPPNTNGEKVEGVLHLDGRLWNEVAYDYDQWTLKIPDGQEYTVSKRGSSTTEASGWKDGYIILGGGRNRLFEFRAPGMTTIPDRLELRRTIVNRLYTNVEWSAPMKEEHKLP